MIIKADTIFCLRVRLERIIFQSTAKSSRNINIISQIVISILYYLKITPNT